MEFTIDNCHHLSVYICPYVQNGSELEHRLRSLKVLLVSNSHWGIQVVDSATGNAAESISNRHLVDTGGLAVTDPDLPFFCYLKTKVQGIMFKVLCTAVGKFYCFPCLITCTRTFVL